MRTRRILILAIVLSLLLHAIVAWLLRPPASTESKQIERVSIVRRQSTIALPKPPTPPPRPHRTPAPRVVAPKRPRKAATHAAAQPSLGGRGTATPVPTAAPTTAPTSVAGCAQPNAPAAVTASPPPPQIPSDVRAQAISGIAGVTVQLDSNGNVTGAAVAQSTGNSSLDLVAVSMARAAGYSPALKNCKPVASSYAYTVKFVAW